MTERVGLSPGKAESSSVNELAGKYLTFELGSEVYGLDIIKVREIIGMITVTSVPRTPEFVRGVINLRGKVLPVVDLRLKFGMEAKEDTERTCTIVVEVTSDDVVTMGIIVDEVSEVLDVSLEQLEPPPAFGGSTDAEFIMAMGKIGQEVVMLVDVDRMLSSTEAAAVGSAGGEE